MKRPADMAYLSAIHFAEQEDYTGEYTKTVYLDSETFPNEQSVINHFKVIVIDDFDTKVVVRKKQKRHFCNGYNKVVFVLLVQE